MIGELVNAVVGVEDWKANAIRLPIKDATGTALLIHFTRNSSTGTPPTRCSVMILSNTSGVQE